MADQFDELKSPESLREECRSLLAQLQATQRGCGNARIDELARLFCYFDYAHLFPISSGDLHNYIDDRKEELL